MNFNDFLKEGFVKKVEINTLRARSLIKSSKQAVETATQIPLTETTLKTILRELYEGLRGYCEAIGFLKGYKFLNHESITCFLEDILNEKLISSKFDRYRKLRNGVNYYGNDVSEETIKVALKEIPKIIKSLEKHT